MPDSRSDPLIVVGVTGLARSGKDTVASTLSLMRLCFRIALADGIREAFAGLSGPTGELYKELTDQHNYRRTLQLFGSEARESADALGLWVNLLLTKINYLSELHPGPRRRFVIPDVRYRFEYSMIRYYVERRRGRFGMARVVRPGVGPIAESGHSSEAEVDMIPVDISITNNGTIEGLAGAAVGFFDRVAGMVGANR